MEKKVHEMKLQPEPFDAIKAGKKIIELRLYDDKRHLIKIGDFVVFKRNPDFIDSVKVEVVALLNYPSFDELISDFDSNWFGLSTREELQAQVGQFYSAEEQEKYGVIGIKIKLL